ncbi:hypothetical protein MMC24_002883 [Lignoscripta atroalba]|nr:hypothetical protein [Lignoscripta atroalba]
MGHSFDAGRQHPPLPKDLKSLGLGLAASSEKRKSVGTPRSPVLSSPSDDYGEIREFLRTEPPPPPPSDYLIRDQSSSLLGRRPLISLRGDSHRKKHSLDEIFKSGYLSSKQLKHLLLRSRSTSLARKSTAEGLAKDVALQKAIGGREYRQIVADPARVQSSGNLSVYKVNCRREQQGVEPIVMEHKDTPTHDEPVIPTSQSPSQILEGDAFGISKEFPHLWPLTDAVTTTPQNNTSTETYAPPISIPRQGVGSNIRDFGSQSKDTASDTQFAVHAKHPATVSDYPNSSFQSRHNKGLLSNPPTSQTPKGGPRNWMRRSPRPLPLDIQARSQQQTPPRPSSRPLGSELNADSPPHLTPPLDSPPNKQSSTHPGSASTAYDIHSDTSSGKVMSAQSLDMIRFQGAGYLNNKSRKPPKPSGPAPTRALPLLPEDHDPLNASNRISIGPANGQTSIVGPHFDQSPNQLPQKPPSRRYGYPAFDILNSNLTPTNVPPRAKTAPDLNQHRMQSVGSVSPEEGENSSASRKLDGEPSTAGMSPDVLTEWATRRDQVTKERKKRDLEREREARHRWETKKFVDINSSEEDTIPRDAEWQQQDNTDTIVTLPSVENDSGPHPNNNDSPCSTASAGACKSPASQSSAQSASDSNSIKRDPPKPPRSQQCHLNADSDSNSNKISPVLLIAEQAPIYATEYCKMQTTTFKSPTSTNAHRSLESTSKNTNTQKSHQRQEKESQIREKIIIDNNEPAFGGLGYFIAYLIVSVGAVGVSVP